MTVTGLVRSHRGNSPQQIGSCLLGTVKIECSITLTVKLCPMKNITVSVNEEVWRLSRIKAAEAGSTVSALVRQFLVSLIQGNAGLDEFDRLERLQTDTLREIRARGAGLASADNLSREELHARDALR